MNQIVHRRCGNCISFGALPGIACSNAVAFVGPDGALIAATADDCCDEHCTDLEAKHAEYERSAELAASMALLIGVGA